MADIFREKHEKVAAYVICLVASAINSVKAPEKPDDVSWNDVTVFAKSQSVLNLVSYACETLENKPGEEQMKYLRDYRKRQIIIEAEQEIETADVLDRFEALGVRHMPLKGYVIKNLYPSPDMRTMGDIDILVEASKEKFAIEALMKEGYGSFSDGILHSSLKHGNVEFEFHRRFVDYLYKKLTAYYGEDFFRAVKSEGYEYRYELTNEDFYVFLVVHLAKHYRYGGTGIRTVLDLYVFRGAYPELNMDYVTGELEKIGLNIFHEKMMKIANNWFGGVFDGKFDAISFYIVSSSVYGDRETVVVNRLINNSNEDTFRKNRALGIFKMIFPSYEIMCDLFPIVKKCPVLLPVMWVVRWIKSLTSKNSNFKNTLDVTKDLINLDDETIAIQKEVGITDL